MNDPIVPALSSEASWDLQITRNHKHRVEDGEDKAGVEVQNELHDEDEEVQDIQVGNHDLAEDSEEEPGVEGVVPGHLMRVKRSVAVTEGEATSDEIEAIAAEEGVFNRAH